MSELIVGWTTVAQKKDAEKIATEIIKSKLAACVQFDGPIYSVYEWKGEIKNESEYRLTIKFPSSNVYKMENWIKKNHPYETPQWVVVDARSVSKDYLSWVNDVTCKS